MQAARLKQHGRRCLPLSFEMVFSILIARVSWLSVAFIQRIHSQRAIGVMFCHLSLTFGGAVFKAIAKSSGTCGSGQSLVGVSSSLAVSPALTLAAFCSLASIRIQ